MRYLGYLLIAGVFLAGFFSIHILAALAAALLATLIFGKDRAKALRNQPQTLEHNMLLDGAYLFGGQILIMFVVYILGWFFANTGTSSGMLGKTVQAFIIIGIIGTGLGLFLRSKNKAGRK